MQIIKKETKKDLPLPFLSIFGRKSVFSKSNEQNCYDWARGKLEILDIYFPEFCLDKIVTITKRHLSSGESGREDEPSNLI